MNKTNQTYEDLLKENAELYRIITILQHKIESLELALEWEREPWGLANQVSD